MLPIKHLFFLASTALLLTATTIGHALADDMRKHNTVDDDRTPIVIAHRGLMG